MREALTLALEALEAAKELASKHDSELEYGFQHTITALREASAPMSTTCEVQPKPPFECRTEEEKTAFAFGWWKALETQRMVQPVQKPDIYPEEAFDMGLEAVAYYTKPPAQPEQEADAVAALTEEGWIWDGDQWQRPAQPEHEPVAFEEYDAGLLNDFGGGNVEWWWDYIRAELGRAYEHYQSQITTPSKEQPEPVPIGNRPKEEDYTKFTSYIEALEIYVDKKEKQWKAFEDYDCDAIDAMLSEKKALAEQPAQPEQEPMAMMPKVSPVPSKTPTASRTKSND